MKQLQINALVCWLLLVEGMNAPAIRDLICLISGKGLQNSCILKATSLETVTHLVIRSGIK